MRPAVGPWVVVEVALDEDPDGEALPVGGVQRRGQGGVDPGQGGRCHPTGQQLMVGTLKVLLAQRGQWLVAEQRDQVLLDVRAVARGGGGPDRGPTGQP